MDGVLSPGEWTNATSHVIAVNTAAGAVPATLYVMNDNLTLYLALKFAQSAANASSVAVEFDNDNDGVPFEAGDDEIVFGNQTGFFDNFLQACGSSTCSVPDTSDVLGFTDGRGAYVNDGTNSVYEISHPYNNDRVHDLPGCFGIGGVVTCNPAGFFIHLQVLENGTTYDTYYPDFGVYDRISFQPCLSPLLSGCGTSSVDGTIGSAEWAGAGQYRLSVNITSRGDTTPATLYVMNDSVNLYMALAFDQTAAAPFNRIDLFFDTSSTGSIGDYLVFCPSIGGFLDFDWVTAPCTPPPLGSSPCLAIDTGVGGTSDGAGAVANNGVQTAIEISHPLNSGDSHDFALSYGDTIPYSLTHVTGALFPGVISSTSFANLSLAICTPGPAQSVRDLNQQVDALETSRALSSKNADSLHKDLSKANGNIQSGKLKQAANDLANFINDVTKMMRKGELADRNGQRLIAAANTAMSQL